MGYVCSIYNIIRRTHAHSSVARHFVTWMMIAINVHKSPAYAYKHSYVFLGWTQRALHRTLDRLCAGRLSPEVTERGCRANCFFNATLCRTLFLIADA